MHKLYLLDIMDVGRSENCSLVYITHKPPVEKMLSGLPIKRVVGYPYFARRQQHSHPFWSFAKPDQTKKSLISLW